MGYIRPLRREVRDAWAEWLEDPSHMQTNGRLARIVDAKGTTAYCCLGGLCEVAIAHGVTVDRVPLGSERILYDRDSALPPPSVLMWAYGSEIDDIDANIVIARRDGRPLEAAAANDALHWTFAEIAAAVRKMPTVD